MSEVEKGTPAFDVTQTLAQYMGGLLTAEQVLKTLKANKGQVFVYTDKNLAIAALKFNSYNMSEYSSDYYKNKVMAAIRYASQDLKNLKASQVPMEAKYVNDCIKRSVEEYGTSDGVRYFNEDPTHIINFQYQAAIGKEGVGISANSIKVVGTVQQRHNIKHAEEADSKRQIVPDLQIDLEFPLIDKNGNEKRKVTEMIRKMPNTKLSFDLFKQYFTLKDLLNHPFNELYQKLQTKQEIIDPSSKQQRFIDAYKLSADKSFLNVLYKMYENEENVADMLSVFISLCTDNAKELALYKIAGVPELLNLPLAMISLGMEMQDITDICVSYLLPVLDKLNVSSIQQSHQTNILLIFADLGKNNPSMKAGYDSLVKIYESAQEMKLIAGYFKINQGTSVTYSEVLSFLDRLDRKIKDSGLVYDGQVVKFRDFFKEDSEDLKKYAVHFYEYGDANHEAPKTAFNIFDIILNSPHFYEQLKATNSIVDHIQSISGLAHIAAKLYSQNNANNKANPTRVTQIVQNALLSNSLRQMSDITFDKASTLAKFGQWSPELGLSTQIGISDFTKIDNFINFIQEAVVPYLKHNFKDNFFVLLLDINNRTGFYELPFRSYEVRGDIRTKTDINKAQLAFYQIAALQSGLRTLNGTPITIGDLMYIYSVITTENRTNTTTTVMYNGMNKFTKLNFDLRLHEYYAEVDRITGIATLPLEAVVGHSTEYEDAKEKLQLLIDQIDPYVKAEYNDGFYTNGNIKYTVDKNRVLYTMYPGEAVSEIGISQEGLYQFINQVLTNNNSGAIIEENSISIQGNSLTFKLRIPNKVGQVETRIVKLHNLALTSDKSISQSALREIQEQLSQNIVPTYQVLAQLQLYSTSNPTLYENQKLNTIEELESYTNIKSLKNNDLYKSMLDWMNKEQDIIVISGDSYIKSHVEKIGNTNTVVINKYDFVGKADDEKLIILLNLFVDSQLDGIPSENKRFNFLLKSVLNIKGVTGTIELAVQNKEVLKLIGENKLIEKWYHQLINDSEINDIRQTAAAGMVQFQRALRDPDLYYYDYDSNNKGQNLPGDIFENVIDKQTYIFLGYTPTGKYIFVNTNPEANNKVQPFSEVTTNKNYKRIKRCKTHINYSLTDTYQNVTHTNLGNYKETMKLQVGDKIIRNDRVFYISDVLYTFNKNGYTVEYIVTTDDQKRVLLTPNTKDIIEKLNVQEIVANKTVNSSDVSGASTEFKSRLLNVLGVGVQVSIDGNSYIVKQLQNDLIVTTDNQLLNVSDVTEIQIAELLLTKVDPFYGLLLQTDKIIIDKIDLPLIRTAPLFRDAVQDSKSVNDKTASFTARTVINGRLFHNFDLPHNVVKMGLVTDEVETGDYILRYKPDNNTYSCYHVLEVNGETAVVLECNQSDEVNRQSAIKTVSISKELLGGQLYKHESNLEKRRIVSRTDKHINNPSDQVYQFMDRLASMFGTRVEIIHDEHSVLAQVKDGLVVINIAKKPENQSVVDYLLEQSIHEFSHLAVLALRANDPEQYLKLIQLVTKNWSLNGKFYTNYILQQEETLVRFLTDKIKEDSEIFDREIYDIYKSAFESLFGEEGMISEESYADTASTAKYGDFTRSIQDAFQKMSWLKENVKLSTLREKALSDEVLEKIDIICK